MQQGDPTVLSLRPGGGRAGGSRLFAHSSSSSSSSLPSADPLLSRPHASSSLKEEMTMFSVCRNELALPAMPLQ
ncbi:unnamed protein product [Sphenostylis stenocarpa]|uniref:Uncharacterized protein n=1 Tax=Sphenostylis stenocarpa TaxID=92480 RepID=A0AA86VRB0_9FABA|nr:unnamed protein product [Sphenostylis stenocarpa]